jgi:hypothetical protein
MKNVAVALILAAVVGCSTATKESASSLPRFVATHINKDFEPSSDPTKSTWKQAPPVTLNRGSRDAKPRPELATTVRALWSDKFLYLLYDCPYTQLTVFEPVRRDERFGLWEKDVVEVFIAPDATDPRRYTEYEVSPTNERLDVKLPEKDFAWSSGFESATRVDTNQHRWFAELRIPLSAMSDTKPRRGSQWRINLYRCDYANKAFLAFSPTLTGTFHAPERFGFLEFR